MRRHRIAVAQTTSTADLEKNRATAHRFVKEVCDLTPLEHKGPSATDIYMRESLDTLWMSRRVHAHSYLL